MAMAPAGKRDTLITIERYGSVGEDDFGAPILDWSEHSRPWARVFYGRGDERRQAAREGASQSATFVVLANAKTRAITPGKFRIAGEAPWDITAAVPIDRGEIEITATRRAS